MSDSCTVNVFDENGQIIGRVKYCENLDVWNGNNFTAGKTGKHKGITRITLKTGEKRFVLISGSQWPGEESSGQIISDEAALQEILHAEKDKLLEKYFPDYQTMLPED